MLMQTSKPKKPSKKEIESVKRSEQDLKDGKYHTFRSAKDFDRYLDSLPEE